MKRFFILAALAASLACTAQAQTLSGFIFGAGAGAALTTSQECGVTPAVQALAGYRFSPLFTLRGSVGYNAVRSGVDDASWTLGTAQASLDLKFSARPFCTVSPYAFAGLGANYRWNTASADYPATAAWNAAHGDPTNFYAVECNILAACARTGVGADFRLSRHTSLFAELQADILPDSFNCLKERHPDLRVTALAGITHMLPQKARTRTAEAEPLSAQSAVDAYAAMAQVARTQDDARADSLAALLAATRTELDGQKAETREAWKTAARNAARNASTLRAVVESEFARPLFSIGSAALSRTAKAQCALVAAALRANPEAVVTVTGYADRETGNPVLNADLSQARAVQVAKYLQKHGVDPSHILARHKGDTERVADTPEQNRTCTFQLDF